MTKYSISEIIFANITNEVDKINRIKQILDINPFNGYQLIDDNSLTFNQFKSNIDGFPTTIILGKKGNILWIGHPSDVNEKLILEKTGLKASTDKKTTPLKKKYILRINDSRSKIMGASSVEANEHHIIICYTANSLHTILAKLYDNFSLKRIVSTDTNSNLFGIDIFAKFPREKYTFEDVKNIIINELQNKYKFKISSIHEKETVLLVQLENKKRLNSWETSDEYSSSGVSKNKLNYHGYTLKKVFLDFEEHSNNLFKIDDDLRNEFSKKTYDLTLYKNTKKLISKLKKNYGLKLSTKKLAIEKLKLTFSEKVIIKFRPKEELTKLISLSKEKYEVENMLGEWFFVISGQESSIKLLKNEKGKLDGNLIFDDGDTTVKMKNILVKGNKISFLISFNGEESNVEIWFLNKKTAKGHINKEIFIELNRP
jgi:hypothetical protein